MKKLSKIVMVLMVIFVMSGCANRSVHMDISSNGKVTLSAIIAYAESASTYGMSVTEEEKEEYEKLGYKVENYKEEDMVGVKISKTYHIKDVSSKESVTVHLESVGSSSFEDDILFQSVGNNSYKANFVIDTKTGYDSSLASFSSQFDISYSVTLPEAPKSHNADAVDGNTLTWKVNYGEEKNINYEFSLKGSNSFIYTIIGTIVIIAIIIAVITLIKKSKNKSKTNGIMNTVQPNNSMTENNAFVSEAVSNSVESSPTNSPLSNGQIVEQSSMLSNENQVGSEEKNS